MEDPYACMTCDQPLAGLRYVMHDDKPHCSTCFETNYANVCVQCDQKIGINFKDLSYKGRHWHEQCFQCTDCGKSLLQQTFGTKDDRIYCGKCFDSNFGSRCVRCELVIPTGQRKVEYKSQHWHEQCFLCIQCNEPIGTKSFVPKNDQVYCTECYEQTFATRCFHCNEVIYSGGVMYKDKPWHPQCFVCKGCGMELSGTSFMCRDENPFCRECFGEKYANKCTSCTKPIMGTSQQSTRFINFEDRYWHIECFVCADCRTQLEGRGFINDGSKVICGECAKIRLQHGLNNASSSHTSSSTNNNSN